MNLLRDQRAIDLFTNAIHSTVVYMHAQDYALAKDTYYVESFNNVLNMFQDKRIAFDNEEYTRRSQIAVCHWAENVNRPHTSIWEPPVRLVGHGVRAGGKKKLTKQTFQYSWNIWSRFTRQIYEEYT